MASLIKGSFEDSVSEPLKGKAATVRGKQWLTDNNIHDVLNSFRQENGMPLSSKILLVSAAESHIIAIGSTRAAKEAVSAMQLAEKDVVLVPISDGGVESDSGGHWSLLVFWRIAREGMPFESMTCHHPCRGLLDIQAEHC